MTELDFMKLAVSQARKGIALGQSPFGAVVVLDGRVIAEAHNTVEANTDPTAHAEINALRLASHSRNSVDLRGSTLFATCEPCPMCLGAIDRANISRVVYGASIADAAQAGFPQWPIGAEELARLSQSALIFERGLLGDQCVELFQEWRGVALRRV